MRTSNLGLPRLIPLVSLVVFVLASASHAPTVAQPATDQLSRRIGQVVRDGGFGDRVGVHVVDVASGAELFNHHADLPLNPASNMKLVTAAGALLTLGPEFTMLTGLYGRVEDGGVQDLALRGFGDPTLRMSDLVELADGLADRGVRRVGTVIVDGSYFDDEHLPPAFEQQPDEVAAFRAAVSAVSVERSAYELRVVPGPSAGDQARVRLDAGGYFQLENSITTSEGGAPNVIASQSAEGDLLDLRLRGSVPVGILGVSYRRRVENPLAYAGHAMVEALRRAGIRASGRVQIGATPSGAPLLTSRRSPPVSQVISAMGKASDNYTAEMVLKLLGAERSRPGTSARGAEVLSEMMQEAGVPAGQATFVNGSGLFEGNRVAASHLTRLLGYVYQDPGVRAEYLAHLSVAAVDGTMRRRLRDMPRPRIVRVKTGTLNDVIALSGYVLGPSPERTVAFSVLVNGARGRQGAARAMADDIVRAIAASLYAQ